MSKSAEGINFSVSNMSSAGRRQSRLNTITLEKVLAWIDGKNLQEPILVKELKKMAESITEIGEVRGLGGMVAVEYVKEGDPHKPDADLTKKISMKCLENGLIILSCGVYGNVLRILVPITADVREIEEGIEILQKSTLQVLNR